MVPKPLTLYFAIAVWSITAAITDGRHHLACLSPPSEPPTLTLSCPPGLAIEVTLARLARSSYGVCVPTVRDCFREVPIPIHCCRRQDCDVTVRSNITHFLTATCGGPAHFFQVIYKCVQESDVTCGAISPPIISQPPSNNPGGMSGSWEPSEQVTDDVRRSGESGWQPRDNRAPSGNNGNNRDSSRDESNIPPPDTGASSNARGVNYEGSINPPAMSTERTTEPFLLWRRLLTPHHVEDHRDPVHFNPTEPVPLEYEKDYDVVTSEPLLLHPNEYDVPETVDVEYGDMSEHSESYKTTYVEPNVEILTTAESDFGRDQYGNRESDDTFIDGQNVSSPARTNDTGSPPHEMGHTELHGKELVVTERVPGVGNKTAVTSTVATEVHDFDDEGDYDYPTVKVMYDNDEGDMATRTDVDHTVNGDRDGGEVVTLRTGRDQAADGSDVGDGITSWPDINPSADSGDSEGDRSIVHEDRDRARESDSRLAADRQGGWRDSSRDASQGYTPAFDPGVQTATPGAPASAVTEIPYESGQDNYYDSNYPMYIDDGQDADIEPDVDEEYELGPDIAMTTHVGTVSFDIGEQDYNSSVVVDQSLDMQEGRHDDSSTSADDTGMLPLAALLGVAAGEVIMFIVLIVSLSLYIKRRPKRRHNTPPSGSSLYLEDEDSRTGSTVSLQRAVDKRQPHAKSNPPRAVPPRSGMVPPQPAPRRTYITKAVLARQPKLAYGEENLIEDLTNEPDILNHVPPEKKSPLAPKRKYFYEEACTAFNISPVDDSDLSTFRAVVDELSETITKCSSRDSTPAIPRPHVQHGAPQPRERHFSGRSQRPGDSDATYQNSCMDPRLQEFAKDELQKIDDQISYMFNGNVPGRTKQNTPPPDYI